MCSHIHAYMYTCMYIYMCIHMNMCVFTYVYDSCVNTSFLLSEGSCILIFSVLIHVHMYMYVQYVVGSNPTYAALFSLKR